MLALSTIAVGSNVWAIIVPLAMFGLGGGLALAPLTDTVMAAVPVNDAGVGSAVNGVSRELGSALGVAVIGAVVNGNYAAKIGDALMGSASPQVIESAKSGIGGAVVAGQAWARRATASFRQPTRRSSTPSRRGFASVVRSSSRP